MLQLDHVCLIFKIEMNNMYLLFLCHSSPPPGDFHFNVHASPHNERSAQLLPSVCALSLQANSANITHVLLPYCQKLASHFLFPSPSHFPENYSSGSGINIINVEGKTETEEGGTGAQSMFLCVGENTGRKRLLPGSRANLGQNFLGPSLTSKTKTCLLNGL